MSNFIVNIWCLLGGHVTFGTLIAIGFAAFFYGSGERTVFRFFWSVGIYYLICVFAWILGDLLFGPVQFFTEMPRY